MRLAWAWLSPASLAGRTVLALLAGLLAFHLGSVWLLERGVHTAIEEGREFQVAEHISAAVRVLVALPEAQRELAARAFSSPDFPVSWGRAAPADFADEASLAPLRGRLAQRAPELGGVRLSYANPSQDRSRAIEGGLQLPDSSWIGFTANRLDAASIPSHATLTSLSAMALGIVLASLVVVRWITNPLRRLARAAESFGKGAAPVPLREDGPREVRDAAKTFNAMQARIHRLVSDRTEALAAVSHDLRTPIQRLRLRAGFLDDAESQRAIDADLDEMEGMVGATLAYLRGEEETEPPRQADLAAILGTLCDEWADRGATVPYAGPDRLYVHLRSLPIKRALANLIDNAVKYGGNARVLLADEGEAVTVLVEDDGPGIPETELEAVFEPFYRLDASRNRGTGGTGLGLAIARQVLRGHGGTIRLANRPHGGVTATVLLPKASAALQGGGEAERSDLDRTGLTRSRLNEA